MELFLVALDYQHPCSKMGVVTKDVAVSACSQ